MSIILRELRTAVQNYLDTKVTVTISSLTPAAGTSIQPNETFTFSVTATNTSGADAIRLVNVRYHLRVVNPSVAKLVGPATNPDSNGITYKKPGLIFGTQVNLTANEEVGEMYLYPPASITGPFILPDRAGDLDIGDSDTINGLKGKAGSTGGGGNTQITCRVLAEPDMDFLYPKNEDSPTASRVLAVIG